MSSPYLYLNQLEMLQYLKELQKADNYPPKYILVGLKGDLRHDIKTLRSLEAVDQHPVTEKMVISCRPPSLYVLNDIVGASRCAQDRGRWVYGMFCSDW